MNLKEPSTKIDLAVAEAVGIGAAMLADQCCYCDTSDPDHDDFRPSPSNPKGAEVFAPSRDWTAAMTAAKAYLADEIPSRRCRFAAALRDAVTPPSMIGTISWEVLFELLVATGPLAICAAILETPKGKPDAHEND